jgi:NAD(P)-dependent dehydrogenase (short-subunit alcohol dehydrogenase family)
MELQDKVVVVTGAARGIGFALAQAFVAAGARHVVVVDLRQADVDAAVAQLGERTSGVALDVADRGALHQLVADVEAAHGPIDLFASNAGIASGAGVEASDEVWQAMFGVNVLAHVHAAEAVLPSMLARGEGYLLSTASAAGLLSQIGDLPYSVTKHAAVAVAEWLAITYADRGITVSCLCPQGVNTAMVNGGIGHEAAATVVAQGLLEPEQVAAEVVAAIGREDFLILPHPEVAEYYRRRATDPDRWLAGMSRLQARIVDALG